MGTWGHGDMGTGTGMCPGGHGDVENGHGDMARRVWGHRGHRDVVGRAQGHSRGSQGRGQMAMGTQGHGQMAIGTQGHGREGMGTRGTGLGTQRGGHWGHGVPSGSPPWPR